MLKAEMITEKGTMLIEFYEKDISFSELVSAVFSLRTTTTIQRKSISLTNLHTDGDNE